MTAAERCIDLCGEWEFLPGLSAPDQLPATLPERITVPGLWEAQGWPALDGEAWYRTWFELPADAAEQEKLTQTLAELKAHPAKKAG